MDPCCPQISQKTSFRASKQLRKFRTRKTAKNSKLCYNLGNWKDWKRQLWGSKWDRWVATNIHLDQQHPQTSRLPFLHYRNLQLYPAPLACSIAQPGWRSSSSTFLSKTSISSWICGFSSFISFKLHKVSKSFPSDSSKPAMSSRSAWPKHDASPLLNLSQSVILPSVPLVWLNQPLIPLIMKCSGISFSTNLILWIRDLIPPITKCSGISFSANLIL